MRVLSYAKINWSLRITGKRTDRYHDLETLFQTIGLHDVLTIEPAKRNVLVCDDPMIPTGPTNLISRAAQALGSPPVRIELQKRIPSGGGLGGGSSNAAAALLALDELFQLDTPFDRLQALAISLGSDVPFFLLGGTAYATGRGEQLTPMSPSAGIPLLLVLPEERVSTPEAFRAVRRFTPPLGLPRYRQIEGDLLAHAAELTNDFEEPVFARFPRLGEHKQRLLDAGAAWAAMSGSGSTVVGAFRTAAARDAALLQFGDVRVAATETL
ncbi:MAG: ispE [Acidobacteria bacterium]|nr:ispE [Acidobacteriota bacterium]